MRITPIVNNDFLLLILTIPLIDKSLQMNLYRAHNLPALHPALKSWLSYILKGQYLTLTKHSVCATIPIEHDICICIPTQGYLSMMNQFLYTVECMWKHVTTYEQNQVGQYTLLEVYAFLKYELRAE